jgi:hypothetical protein
MQNARTGAVAMAVGQTILVLGGLGTANTPIAAAELYDPSSGLGSFSPVPADAFSPRYKADLTVLSSGSGLVTGGLDASNNRVNTAVLISTDSGAQVSAIAGPMVAGRVEHAVARAKFSDGDGAILYGGLPAGSTAAVAERLVGQNFEAYPIAGADNRTQATASTLNSGQVIILGGHSETAGKAVASGIVVTPNTNAVNLIPQALSTAREGHSATVLDDGNLLVCGGADSTGALVASCDLIDGNTFGIIATTPLSTGRKNHSASLMENGLVLLSGGLDAQGKPLALIEIYTP